MSVKIKIESEVELLQTTAELLHVLYNLRHWTKEWQENHGVQLLTTKKHWEERADKLLAKLQMGKTYKQSDVEISFQQKINSE